MGEGTFLFNEKLKDSMPSSLCLAESLGLGPHPGESGHLKNGLNSWHQHLVKPDPGVLDHKNPGTGSGRHYLMGSPACPQPLFGRWYLLATVCL